MLLIEVGQLCTHMDRGIKMLKQLQKQQIQGLVASITEVVCGHLDGELIKMWQHQEQMIKQMSAQQFRNKSDDKELQTKDANEPVPTDTSAIGNPATGAAALQAPTHQGTVKRLSRSTSPKRGLAVATAFQMAATGVQLEQRKLAGNETRCMVRAQQSQTLKPLSLDRVSTVLDESGCLGSEPCADDSLTTRSVQSSDEGTGVREPQELFRVPLHRATSSGNSSPCLPRAVAPWQIPIDREAQRPAQKLEAKPLPRSTHSQMRCASPCQPQQVPAATVCGRSVVTVACQGGPRVRSSIACSGDTMSLQLSGRALGARTEGALRQGVARMQSAPEVRRPCR